MHDRTARGISRLKIVLASSGVICTLLIGNLTGFHGVAAAASAQVATTNVATIVTKQVQTTVKYANGGETGYRAIAYDAAVKAGINPDFFIRQIETESHFNPNAASGAGAVGIAQFMPSTAASMGINPYDPTQALNAAARLMANLNAQYGGDYAKALAAYNAGSGNVESAVRAGGGNWKAYLPGETQSYISQIMG